LEKEKKRKVTKMAFNKVILIGNMTSDPELKQTQGGLSVSSFSIAVNRRFAKEGEQACDFINIVAWRQQAEFVTRYFKKGNPILVCGSLQTRTWTDNQGNKRYATEVVADEVSFVGNKESDTELKPQPYVPSAYTSNNQNFEEIPNDASLPF
jgi:single-strand DNA-binding protein